MNTIIEKIRAEILRLIETEGAQVAIAKVLAKLDTLQEQPVDTSEDERIREEIKNFLDDICYLKASITPEDLDRDAISRWIAYLNRQSKEQPVYKEALTEYISKRLKELWDSSSAQDDHDAYYRNPTVKELKDIVNIIDSL